MSKQNIFTPGGGYYTKSNNPVTIYAVYTTEIHGAVFAEGKWNSRVWHPDGRYSVFSHVWDIMPLKKVVWLNLYDHPMRSLGFVYSSKEHADIAADGNRRACVKVEYMEGQFDE